MNGPIQFRLGVKTDPIEYRYSHEWLFRILADEDVRSVQIGTHFELYQLPDEFFHELRKQADDAGVVIESMFTAHRELGGFFREEPGYEQVARKNFERYIQVGGLLGAKSVGSNPGAVMRDRMGGKEKGIECYLKHMKELMHLAHDCGVEWLTIEPMSCLAEPPTLPNEIAYMGDVLTSYHHENSDGTSRVGYCTDIAHGYADQSGNIIYDHFQLLDATLPYLYEIHLKNTDPQYNSTFGFTSADRERGIIDVPDVGSYLQQNAAKIPIPTMAGYLEIGGPKLGRDYSDFELEASLRESLRYLKQSFVSDQTPELESSSENEGSTDHVIKLNATEWSGAVESSEYQVDIAPSMMCVDPLNFESQLRRVEAMGVDMLHMDIMDGRFVPNMPMGIGILESLSGRTHLPIDVHLMVEDNDFYVEQIGEMGVSQISVHVESCTHLDRTLESIRSFDAKAGAAINPGTPLQAIEYVLERLDYVLIMTVNPGYAGQKMTPASIRKIRDCRSMLDDAGYESLPIQVDGNVSFANIPGMVAAGAANLVAGTSSIFHSGATMRDNMKQLREAIETGLASRVS